MKHNPQQLDFGFSELVEKPTRIARGSDPITSKLSELETKPKLGELQQLFVEVLDGLGAATAREIQREVEHIPDSVDAESVRKRAGELVTKKLIEVVGHRHCKQNGPGLRAAANRGKRASRSIARQAGSRLVLIAA